MKNIVLLYLLSASVLCLVRAGSKSSVIKKNSFFLLLGSFAEEKMAIVQNRGPELVVVPTCEQMKQARDKAVRQLWYDKAHKKDSASHVITELEEKIE